MMNFRIIIETTISFSCFKCNGVAVMLYVFLFLWLILIYAIACWLLLLIFMDDDVGGVSCVI